MTLVVSEVSKHGITMVGDSAVTIRGPLVKVASGAKKLHYSPEHNAGFAIWGHATVNGTQLDHWLENLIDNGLGDCDGLEAIGNRVAQKLSEDLRNEGKPWQNMVVGVHIAGYERDLPRLWHVHCGHPGEPPHEPRLDRENPQHQRLPDSEYRQWLDAGNRYHFRNGYYQLFSLLFEHMDPLLQAYRDKLQLQIPQDNLDGRLAYHRLLVRFVAGVLVAANKHPGVNDDLSYLGFTQKGQSCAHLMPVVDWLGESRGTADQSLWL